MGSGQILTKAVEDGYLLCLLCPDWRSKSLEQDVPRVGGKMALMPLPVFPDGGYRTSTLGGTMLGITKHCKHPDLAWELAMHLYTGKAELGERFEATNIMPPLREAWDQTAFHEKKAYWSGQRLGDLYASYAPHVPYQYSSPFMSTAKLKLGEAVCACVRRYNTSGDAGFEDFARKTLRRKADEVRRMIGRNPY
jgi:hypothetical protein